MYCAQFVCSSVIMMLWQSRLCRFGLVVFRIAGETNLNGIRKKQSCPEDGKNQSNPGEGNASDNCHQNENQVNQRRDTSVDKQSKIKILGIE